MLVLFVHEVDNGVVLLQRALRRRGARLLQQGGELLGRSLALRGALLHLGDEVLGLLGLLEVLEVGARQVGLLALQVLQLCAELLPDLHSLLQLASESARGPHEVGGCRVASRPEEGLQHVGGVLHGLGRLLDVFGELLEVPGHAFHLLEGRSEVVSGVGTGVHRVDRALDQPSAHRGGVAGAGDVAVGAVACHGLVVGRAVAVVAVPEAEEDHLRHRAAEGEARRDAHGLPVLALHQHFVVQDGHVGDGAQLVREPVVAELVAMLEHVVLDAVHLVEAVLQYLPERLDGGVHASPRVLCHLLGAVVLQQRGDGAHLPAVLLIEVHGQHAEARAAQPQVPPRRPLLLLRHKGGAQERQGCQEQRARRRRHGGRRVLRWPGNRKASGWG
mmetsp:Transcript_31785/g.98901  ORF Transcript_31785/g.98901 Transcript_31785/m.98901 type:complete len:388 (+) Transcript_31785:447-1610(+)